MSRRNGNTDTPEESLTGNNNGAAGKAVSNGNGFKPRELEFKIFRYEPGKEPYYQTYKYVMPRAMTLLECLLAIQDEQDGTLAFRYSCRSAVCGSCAMLINGKPGLACKTQISTIVGNRILLEPLPNLEVIKDLVVDMQPFWDAYRRVEPWLHEDLSDRPEAERLVSPKAMDKLIQYVNCILCGACYGACTVLGRDGEYLGPAALAKMYRFVLDPRDHRDFDLTVMKHDHNDGVWACDTLFRCVEACPHDVRPTDAIIGLRKKMVAHKVKKFFGMNKKSSGGRGES